jgi:hypothetical protein
MSEIIGDNKTGVGIRRMLRRDAGQIFSIAERCGLGYWSQTDYEKEIGRPNCVAAAAETKDKNIIGFMISRLIMLKNDDNNINRFSELLPTIEKNNRSGN